MSKHNIGDVVGHSTKGNGTITAIKTVTKTFELDVDKARDEALKLRARLEWLERMIPIANKPTEVEVYVATFPGGKQYECEDWEIDKLKQRIR